MTYLTLTCYKSIAACQEHEEEKMGAGLGCTNPHRVPQGPQPKAVEIPEEAKPQEGVDFSGSFSSKEESTNSPNHRVDEKSNSNCFLNAKNLKITWADSAGDNGYWRWSKIEETSNNTMVDAAELLNVCWLEVYGKFETRKLSPGTTYEAAFVIMLKDLAYGWEVPVNVRLVLPGGDKQERKENLMKKPRGEWIEIPVGEFIVKEAGDIEFSIYEYEGGKWKGGLVIKGVAIRPKN